MVSTTRLSSPKHSLCIARPLSTSVIPDAFKFPAWVMVADSARTVKQGGPSRKDGMVVQIIGTTTLIKNEVAAKKG